MLADGYVRYRGEAVLALVGDAATIATIDDDEVPIALGAAAAADRARRGARPRSTPAPRRVPGQRPGRGPRPAGRRRRRRSPASAVTADGTFETTYVEHAYIEPEAGTARLVDGRVEVFATTQTPYMDRDELALILGLPEDRVRVIPSACGGGFGGKLDLSLQPLIAIAALLLDRPVRALYPRPESMASTTKRHPARIRATVRRRRDRPAHRRLHPRRLRHRRLRLVGPDGGQPRAGPRDGPVRGRRGRSPPAGPCTRTGRPPARSVASACRRPRSPTRR